MNAPGRKAPLPVPLSPETKTGKVGQGDLVDIFQNFMKKGTPGDKDLGLGLSLDLGFKEEVLPEEGSPFVSLFYDRLQ